MSFMKYLPPAKSKLVPKLKMLRIYWNLGTFDISNIPILILMWKIIFIKYLPFARPKLVRNLKVLRIYSNLIRLIFRISRSRFWGQKLLSLNTYYLFGPNWSQNEKCSKFIEIWYIRYFKHAYLNFDVKNDFYEIFTCC